MSTPLLYRSTSGDQYNWALSSAYNDGFRVFDPSPALRDDPDIYSKVRWEPVFGGAIDQRLHMVASRKWTLQPASDDPEDIALANVLTSLIKLTPRFTESRRLLAEAFLYGSKFAAITGQFQVRRLSGDTGPRRWFIPGRLVDIDRRRIRALATKDKASGNVTVRWEFWHLGDRAWVPWVEPENYVKHIVVRSEDSLGLGKGLIDSLFDLLYAKTIAQKHGLQGLERWAKGVVTVKVNGLRDAKTGNPNLTLLANWIAALKKMTTDGFYAYDFDDQIEVLPGPATGHQIVTDFIDYLDNVAVVRILGAALPSQKSDGGSFALGKVQADTRESIIQGDQELIDDTISVDYVGFLHDVNRPVLAGMGLGNARTPRFETINEPVKDPIQRAQVLKILLDAGVPVKKDEAYGDTGFTVPGEDDEVVVGRPAPSPFGGGGDNPFGGAGGGDRSNGDPSDEEDGGAPPKPPRPPDDGGGA